MTLSSDWASPPGETLAQILREKRISVNEFSSQSGVSEHAVRGLIGGTVAITPRIAEALELCAGGSAHFWSRREAQYQEDLQRIHIKSESWLAGQLPVKDMIKFGWLDKFRGAGDEISACLRFFGVPSAVEWNIKYEGLTDQLTFRRSPSFDLRLGAVAAWFRAAELATAPYKTEHWNRLKFVDSLPEIRALSRQKDPASFMPALKNICAMSGVSLAVLRAPAGCPASGATYFPTKFRAMMILSGRHLSDDHFWFSFFHEAAHLILHGDEAVFLETSSPEDATREIEADRFAEEALIPTHLRSELLALPANKYDVVRFARACGISPGLVVGQLQHSGKLRHNQLNRLKRRYKPELFETDF